jgi:hypothetical protein
MSKRFSGLKQLFRLPLRFHVVGSLAIVLTISVVISQQMDDRQHFANSELWKDVSERWGAPISQPAPSVRYVPSGAVFTELKALPLASQDVRVDGRMNYRKRGLVYFSGFEFSLRARYRVENPEDRDIDAAFVFPIELNKNKILLSDLTFLVNGKRALVDLGDKDTKLVWTGRIAQHGSATFEIAYLGRGLESFTYRLDPALPVRDLHLAISVSGGDNYDYPSGVVSASRIVSERGRLALDWQYSSLESGVPMGVILPSEKSFDQIIFTMVRRAWAPFFFLLLGLAVLFTRASRTPRFYESYLVAAAYGFFFVLLAYLAAFMNFYVAYALSLGVVGALFVFYLRRLLSASATAPVLVLLAATLYIPTLAVILEGYTGLIYCLEILGVLIGLMVMTSRGDFRDLLDALTGKGDAACDS